MADSGQERNSVGRHAKDRRPLRSGPPNAAVLEIGRHAGEAVSATMGGFRTFTAPQRRAGTPGIVPTWRRVVIREGPPCASRR